MFRVFVFFVGLDTKLPQMMIEVLILRLAPLLIGERGKAVDISVGSGFAAFAPILHNSD